MDNYQREQNCECGAAMTLDDIETAPTRGSWYLSHVAWAYWVCPQCERELEWSKLEGYEWKAPSPTLQGRITTT